MVRWLSLRALPLLLLFAASPSVHAAEVWSGRVYSFTKPPFADPTNPVNQDRITTQVWLTRASTMGLFNIAKESFYTHNLSPRGTEWAYGDAVNHASLIFAPWEIWAQTNPPSTVGIPAVVHLIAEDIYIDIEFDGWGATGGFFSYHRAVQPAVPNRTTTWGRIKSLYR
jgi:hypothetical protein